jgi:uncharacterized membrane protein
MVFVNLFFAGLLAGMELIVCYGLRRALTVLDQVPHILIRQALIRRLRVLVPAIFGPAVLTAVAVAVLDGSLLRYLALIPVLAGVLVTAFGTVRINGAAVDWDPQAPPAGWQALITRWERQDLVRCWSALAAFGLLLLAAGTSA